MNALLRIFRNLGITIIILRSNNLIDLLDNPKDEVEKRNRKLKNLL